MTEIKTPKPFNKALKLNLDQMLKNNNKLEISTINHTDGSYKLRIMFNNQNIINYYSTNSLIEVRNNNKKIIYSGEQVIIKNYLLNYESETEINNQLFKNIKEQVINKGEKISNNYYQLKGKEASNTLKNAVYKIENPLRFDNYGHDLATDLKKLKYCVKRIRTYKNNEKTMTFLEIFGNGFSIEYNSFDGIYLIEKDGTEKAYNKTEKEQIKNNKLISELIKKLKNEKLIKGHYYATEPKKLLEEVLNNKDEH